jgi:hypothetical protein
MTMLWILSFIPFVVVGWIGYTFVHAWLTETGSFWTRSLAAGKDSATIVWSKLVILVGMIVPALDKIATSLGDPSLVSQFQQYLTPTTVGISMAAVMALTIWARLRTLDK